MPGQKLKQWFLTISQVAEGENAAELLKRVTEKAETLNDGVDEYVVCNELHQDNNRHVHGFFKFKIGVKLTDGPTFFHVFEHTANCEPCRSAQAVIKYCSKENDYLTNIPDKVQRKKKATFKVRAATLRKYDTATALSKDLISYQSAKAYEYARVILTRNIQYEHTSVRGYWFYGPAGSGKSRAARHSVLIQGERFLKQQNKWWDGYAGQPIVVLDDLDTDVMYHYLKIWTDRYACTGEIKGSVVPLQHKMFIVTSNYTIAELFEKHAKQLGPLTRRFEEVYFPDPFMPFCQPNLYQTSGFSDSIQPPLQERVSETVRTDAERSLHDSDSDGSVTSEHSDGETIA